MLAAWPLVALLAQPGSALPGELIVWRLTLGRVEHGARTPREPLPVGSLQKPFVVQAWARAHTGALPPRSRCSGAAACWRPAGHGTLDLVGALSSSCNAYFLALARDTPQALLAHALRDAGFVLAAAPSPEDAIGLGDRAAVRIAPERLLRAYVDLTRTPWASGEPVRRLVLQGLREAGRVGTAAGLGRRGIWAKTGTVAAMDGQPARTSGWALALDDAGNGSLGLLPHGTGRDAAAALGRALRRDVGAAHRPTAGPAGRTRDGPVVSTLFAGRVARGSAADGPAPPGRELARVTHRRADRPGARGDGLPEVVRVRLLDLLRLRSAWARNLGSAPSAVLSRASATSAAAWVGPGGALELAPGLRLAHGAWELNAPETGLVRRYVGALAVTAVERGAVDGALRLTAAVRLRDYVCGVVAAEAPQASASLRVELGAAVLRFLARGARHAPAADVCDQSHCAVFAGRGPRATWPTPRRALLDRKESYPPPLGDAAWENVRARANQPGPSLFSGHCGGAPLSERYVWGRGAETRAPCPRHADGPTAGWSRAWSAADLARAFGRPVTDVRVDDGDGAWRLLVTHAGGTERLLFDAAHRRLAAVLGWDALPSPALRVRPAGRRGFAAEGVGRGHRVGLCLGAGTADARPMASPAGAATGAAP